MNPPLTKRIAELMLAGESGTVKHWATLLQHPANNLSSILRGMVTRGAAQITATGRGRNGSIYAAGDLAQLQGRVDGSVRRGTRPEGADDDQVAEAVAPVGEQHFACFVAADWSVQLVDNANPDAPIFLSQAEWREQLLPFLQRLNAALDPL